MNKNENSLNKLYNFELICTYEKIKDYDESEILYKIQFLQIFNIEEFDEEVINNITIMLFNYFKDNEFINKLISNTSLKNNKDIAFRMFFAFPTLYMFHKLLSDLYYEKDFDEENYNQLINFTKTNC